MEYFNVVVLLKDLNTSSTTVRDTAKVENINNQISIF